MIHVRLPAGGIDSRERFGLGVVVAASRLLPTDVPAPSVVEVVVVDEGTNRPSLEQWVRTEPRFEYRDSEVLVPRVVLRHVTALAGAALEQRSSVRDRHGRVPATEHPLVQAECWGDPVASRAGLALRDAVLRAAAGRRLIRLVAPWPDGRRWAAAFTHDLDVVRWWPLFAWLRLWELGRKRQLRLVAQALAAAARAVTGDPARAGVEDILEAEAGLGVRSTWFVICATPTVATLRAGDATYTPESKPVRRLLERITDGGHEIGLHGSLATLTGAEGFAAERRRLGALVGQPVHGVRQHFLRIDPGATQRAMVSAGFVYDATLGFADRGGFRLAAADVVPTWDEERSTVTPLEEVPLTWMDRALSKYQGMEDPRVWVDDALALAKVCEEVGGLWVGLWHPNLTPPLGYPGAPPQFRRLINAILGNPSEPYVDTLSAIVDWCVARRSVRAASVAPDGRLVLLAQRHARHAVVLQDEYGRVVERAPWPAPQRL